MKLFPRHLKVIDAIGRWGSVCPNALWQASGVIKIDKACAEMKRKGLVRWTTRRNFQSKHGVFMNNRPPGWTLTTKGWNIYREREVKRINSLKRMLKYDTN